MLFIQLLLSLKAFSQSIPIKNPSLEGIPGQQRAPTSWLVTTSTPDIQPGITGVSLPASDGQTYVGLNGGNKWIEAIAQKLDIDMVAGMNYSFFMDLAFVQGNDSTTCFGGLAIYGANTFLDTTELLWTSGAFTHRDWQRYTIHFAPKKNYSYLILSGDVRPVCSNPYGISFAADHLSDSIMLAPALHFDIQKACVGEDNGAITASATGGYPPYTYLWQPGGNTTPNISHLKRGRYLCTVTAANGAIDTLSALITDTDLSDSARIVSKGCYGDNYNSIEILTRGGHGPFSYVLQNDGSAVDTTQSPHFDFLYAGTYSVRITDNAGCMDEINTIQLKGPDLFKLDEVHVTSTSCTSSSDGMVTFTVSGGTQPYTYLLLDTQKIDSTYSRLSPGTYHYRVLDYNDCMLEGDMQIPAGDRACAVLVPSAFSPNGDGQNDQFRVKIHDDISDFHMKVFGRWGQLLFETTDPAKGWDGAKMPVGTYIWSITYTARGEQLMKQTGSVVLIR